MVKARMLKIIRYLEKEKIASYKEIGEALDLKERSVRYDVDRINDELSLWDAPLIEKRPKGMLFIPDELDFSIIIEDEEFVFSSEERINIIRMFVLFDTKELNIRKLCDELQVSRRSIQNDIDAIQEAIEPYQLFLEYDRGFFLHGESELSYRVRSQELKKYISILEKRKHNTYENYIIKLLKDCFKPVELEKVLAWIIRMIDQMNWKFSDESYQWYVANVLTFTWYVKNDMQLFISSEGESDILERGLDEYETCIGRKLTTEQRRTLSGFIRYTSRYDILDVNLDLISAEDITSKLISAMEQVLDMDFSSDRILRKGLLNHMGPMIERVRGNMQLDEEAESLIPEEYFDIYQRLKSVIRMDKQLGVLTENEIVYLAMYFLGSIRRTQKNPYMNVLLICGFGYGTTALIKDTLRSKFQVHIKESISAYQIMNYTDWDDVDVVVTTVRTELPVQKKMVRVNVIFNEEDYIKLGKAGLRRKNALTNFFGIEKRLDFLSYEDRKKVMEIIKEEFGYQEVKVPGTYNNISEMIRPEAIQFRDEILEWRDAVADSTLPLEKQGSITHEYYDSIIDTMECQGFYAVTDGQFALLHGSVNAGVIESCMSLVITKKPVVFGEKKTNLIFCLASRDKKEHIPAVVRLMRMVNMTDFIEKLKECMTKEQALEVIRKSEREVENAAGTK
ncbi:MAG: BglG family transcription antiterminator [Lachnospiraceae bacterium]